MAAHARRRARAGPRLLHARGEEVCVVTQTLHESAATTPNLPTPRFTELDRFARLGQWLALSESGDVSAKAKGATAALRLYYASELGLTPMAAAELTVIKGRLYVGAQLLRALAVRAGYQIVRVD